MVQTVQKIVKFLHAFLDKVVLPVVMQDRGCPDSAENREDSACVVGHGSCPSLCNDRCRMVETVQKTVESPQLTCPCWSRHGVVELQFFDWCVSSSWL